MTCARCPREGVVTYGLLLLCPRCGIKHQRGPAQVEKSPLAQRMEKLIDKLKQAHGDVLSESEE